MAKRPKYSVSRTPREIFSSRGYTPPALNTLDGLQLRGRVWELLYAAASCRLYFKATDHLSDRSLYQLLEEQWLDRPIADFPKSAVKDTKIDVSALTMSRQSREETQLRYYANDAYIALWSSSHPDGVLPVREVLPFDRDRYLPVPPLSEQLHGVRFTPVEASSDTDEEDPLGLAAVDGEIAGQTDQMLIMAEESSDPRHQREMKILKPEEWVLPADKLIQTGRRFVPPPEIGDEAISAVLWELLADLAHLGFCVGHTDHLTDQALYADLWSRVLRQPALLVGYGAGGVWYKDLLGRWEEEAIECWLRFYATDMERAAIAEGKKVSRLPPKEACISQRDWRLPQLPCAPPTQ